MCTTPEYHSRKQDNKENQQHPLTFSSHFSLGWIRPWWEKSTGEKRPAPKWKMAGSPFSSHTVFSPICFQLTFPFIVHILVSSGLAVQILDELLSRVPLVQVRVQPCFVRPFVWYYFHAQVVFPRLSLNQAWQR